MKKVISCLALSAMLFTAAFGQSAPPMPKPGPEQKKMDYFVGDWKISGDIKPGPFGPGGKFTGTEHCAWVAGNFFVECHSSIKMPMGEGTGLSIMGYDPDEKVYTYNDFNSFGQATFSKGTVTGDTWNWTSDSKMNGQVMKSKFTLKQVSATEYSDKYEVAPAGGEFATMMEGKGTKSNR